MLSDLDQSLERTGLLLVNKIDYIIIILTAYFRRYKYESELNKMSWRIRSQDIIFAGRRGGGSVADKPPGKGTQLRMCNKGAQLQLLML